jgi:coenzyme F420 hydrogenase subunit beta
MTDVLSRPTAQSSAIERIRSAPPPFRLRAEMNSLVEAPGKVWFFELAAAVIDADRCVQCGACVAACPTDSIGLSKENLPMLVKMCTGCALCWDFCPRGGLRYEATWFTDGGEHIARSQSEEDDWCIIGVDPAPGFGVELSRVAARVQLDSKYRSTSSQDGGVVTAILLAALEDNAIDGALVAREDPVSPWRGVPFVATTREEIIDAAGSFYNQTMALSALDLSSVGLGPNARIAVVGTPCEVQGIRALQARSWRRGASRVDAIALTIALMCTKSFDYKKLMVESLSRDRGIDLTDVGKVDVIHGRLIVEDRLGATLLDEPIKAFHGAALKGCDECADFLGRGADISVGSVGSEAGFSSVLVRSPAGAQAFERVASELELGELSAPDALATLDRLDKKAAFSSLARPFDPAGPLFIDFAEHLACYEGTERAPMWRGR